MASPDDLRQFLAGMRWTRRRGGCLRRDGWWVDYDPPFDDFNREIIQPGANRDFPLGALGIRADDNFWTVALLPYKFARLSCADLVAILFPTIENPVIRPDHGDPWWDEDRREWNEWVKRGGRDV